MCACAWSVRQCRGEWSNSILSRTGPNYPEQVLVLSAGNAQVAGMDTTFVTPPSRSGLAHLLLDSVTREAYYYHSSTSTIYSASVQSGDEVVSHCVLHLRISIYGNEYSF